MLLLDEPFSASDTPKPVRAALRRDVRSMQFDAGVPSVVVTHDPDEAAMLAEEVLVIAAGRVLQAGRVREVFDRPASPEVARLLGIDNVFSSVAGAGGSILVGGETIATRSGQPPEGCATERCVRADDITLGRGSIRGIRAHPVDRSAVDAFVEITPTVIVRVSCGRVDPPPVGTTVALDIALDVIHGLGSRPYDRADLTLWGMPLIPFSAKESEIPGLFIVEMKQVEDDRGVVREFSPSQSNT